MTLKVSAAHCGSFACVWKGFPGGSDGKESTCSAEDLGSIPALGRSPAEGKGYPLQYSGLYSPWGHEESDTTEWLSLSKCQHTHQDGRTEGHGHIYSCKYVKHKSTHGPVPAEWLLSSGRRSHRANLQVRLPCPSVGENKQKKKKNKKNRNKFI